MKIVQSYWSLPSQSSPMEQGRDSGGWLHKRYHYLSMSLSCLLLRRFYSEVELVTDTAGKEILIDLLELPYTKVSTDLDHFSNYPPILWALPKLYAYSIQRSPFLHVDGDVFIWDAFKPNITQAPVVVQSPDFENEKIYSDSLSYLRNLINYVPEPLASSYTNNFKALNAGVLGGTDVDFLSFYGSTALYIIQENINIFREKCEQGTVNLVLEQLSLYNLCKENNKSISYIVPLVSPDFNEVLNFYSVPVKQTFIHLLGHAKKSSFACNQVEYRLKYEFPTNYEHIVKAIDDKLFIANSLPASVHSIDYRPDFACTQFVLHQMGIYIYNIYSFRYKTIKFVINNISDQQLKAFVRDVYQLDKCRKILSYNPSIYNWADKKKIYQALELRSQEYILSCPLTLVPSLCIIETKWDLESISKMRVHQLNFELYNDESYYILIQNKEAVIIEEQLHGWDKLLVYFYKNIMSGYELLIEAKKDGFPIQTDFEQSMLIFILVELLYKERLMIN
jgi:hypothetical protein